MLYASVKKTQEREANVNQSDGFLFGCFKVCHGGTFCLAY